jgi:hypothetical protein
MNEALRHPTIRPRLVTPTVLGFISLLTNNGKRSILAANRLCWTHDVEAAMKTWLIAAALVGLTVSCDLNGPVSGKFRLREDSLLPSWLTLPAGTTRDAVSVTITSYERTGPPTWLVKFEVRDKRSGRIIQKVMGTGYWHPDSEREKAPAGTFPNWIVIEINGMKDVYEQSEFNDLLKIVKK